MTDRLVRLVVLVVVCGACAGDREESESSDRATSAPESSSVVVDSLLPMDVLLARFREGIPPTDSLSGGAASREALVDGVVRALAAQDTAALERMALGQQEFAWLYYPTTTVAKPPYELPPGLAWLQMGEENRKGVYRALAALGGKQLRFVGHACSDTPVVEGENRIWSGCRVTLAVAGREPAPFEIFSSILERGGRFVVLSYANDL